MKKLMMLVAMVSASPMALAQDAAAINPAVLLAGVFIMACFVGYYVVWSVSPALHTPLMSVTNAISAVVIVGGLIAVTATSFDDVVSADVWVARGLGAGAVFLATINIVGGFLVTQRMLAMYKKKDR